MSVQYNIKSDLQNTIEALRKVGICPDLSPLENAKTSMKEIKGDFYCYCVSELTFRNIPLSRNLPFHSRPVLSVTLDVYIRGIEMDSDDIGNPINGKDDNKYFLSICIKLENNGNVHIDSWHLDFEPDPLGKDHKVEYIHPAFHLTHGGKKMEGLDLGQTMLLLMPRIPFAPMDVILGIDFIVANFYPKQTYFRLRADSRYRNAVKNSQDHLWKPYFMAISSNWEKSATMSVKDSSFMQNILPYMI